MAKSCPECGVEVAYTPRTVELLEATCPGCGKASVVVPGASVSAESGRAAAASIAPSSECWDCGGTLRLTARPDRSVEATCEDCSRSSRLVVPSARDKEEEEDEDEEEDRPRPRRSFDRGEGPREPAGSDRGFRPSARPCRQCGGELQFTQNPDGTVTGSCTSCGNRFTMGPREEGRPRPAYGGRPSFGGPRGRSWSPGPRRPWRDDRGSDGEPRRRRRPRDDR